MKTLLAKKAESAVIPSMIISIKLAPLPRCKIAVAELDGVSIRPEIIPV